MTWQNAIIAECEADCERLAVIARDAQKAKDFDAMRRAAEAVINRRSRALAAIHSNELLLIRYLPPSDHRDFLEEEANRRFYATARAADVFGVEIRDWLERYIKDWNGMASDFAAEFQAIWST